MRLSLLLSAITRLACCSVLSGVTTVAAQSATTGAIKGTVTDLHGRPVSGVTLTATGPNLIRPQSATTDAVGDYRLMNLPPGRYEVTVAANRPRVFMRGEVEVHLSRTSTVNVRERSGSGGLEPRVESPTVKDRPTPRAHAAARLPPSASPGAAPFPGASYIPPQGKESPFLRVLSRGVVLTTDSIGSSPPPLPASGPPTGIYRIGVGDVLNIRLLNKPTAAAPANYTVQPGGLLEFPPVDAPINVLGMTAEELAARLTAEVEKVGQVKQPKVHAVVSGYASHVVIVSGLVAEPGNKIIRREAIPLYVLIADAQPLPGSGRVTIKSYLRGKTTEVNLSDAVGLDTLVYPGDVVTVGGRREEFYYIGGGIGRPGQKAFHSGITLVQAILASGGVVNSLAKVVEVRRESERGTLLTTAFDLQKIKKGESPDPVLRPGDRIEVLH